MLKLNTVKSNAVKSNAVKSNAVKSNAVKLPKALHAKLTQIAASEGKTLSQKLAQAAQEHAAGYERASATVAVYRKKKKL